jgi:hypothetical protein
MDTPKTRRQTPVGPSPRRPHLGRVSDAGREYMMTDATSLVAETLTAALPRMLGTPPAQRHIIEARFVDPYATGNVSDFRRCQRTLETLSRNRRC